MHKVDCQSILIQYHFFRREFLGVVIFLFFRNVKLPIFFSVPELVCFMSLVLLLLLVDDLIVPLLVLGCSGADGGCGTGVTTVILTSWLFCFMRPLISFWLDHFTPMSFTLTNTSSGFTPALCNALQHHR